MNFTNDSKFAKFTKLKTHKIYGSISHFKFLKKSLENLAVWFVLVILTVCCVSHEKLEYVTFGLANTAIFESYILSLSLSQESPELVGQLGSLLQSHPPSDGWRVWLSISAGSMTSLPVSLLHTVSRVVLDTPSVSDNCTTGMGSAHVYICVIHTTMSYVVS